MNIIKHGGIQPVRTAKIDGFRYELIAVGPGGDIGRQALKLLNALPPRSVERTPMTTWDDTWGWVSTQLDYKYPWHPNEAGSPYRVKAAPVAQCRKYPELSAYREMEINERRRVMPSLLWKKIEQPQERKAT